MIWPGNHVSPLPWLLTNTLSPSENWCTLECLSWSNCCLLCFSATFCSKFDFSKSNLERMFLPNNISAGDRSVVVCGVILCWNRILLFDHLEYPLMTCEIPVWTLVQLFQPIHLRKADTVQLNYDEFHSIDILLKLGCSELPTIIRHDRFWNSKLGKQLSQLLYGCQGSSCCHG